MKSLKTILAAALLAVSASAMAQATKELPDGTKLVFQKHAFLDLQGGVQHTLGEAKFADLLSPNVQLGIGYQFSPVIGARLQANLWQSKGGWNTVYNGLALNEDYKWNYVAPGIDLMFNLTNLIGGWDPQRFLNVIAFLGAGANIGWGNDELNDLVESPRFTRFQQAGYKAEYQWDGSQVLPFGRAGLQAAFRLSDAIALTVEGNANILSDKYNSKKADNADWYFNGLVGLKINLGKSYTTVLPPPPAPEPEPYVEPEPEPAPAPVVEKIEPIRRDIFFLINKTDIRESEAPKVKDIADYLKKYPKAKVVVNGYADAGTGNDKINDRLAALRADVVVNALKEQYGIAESRITYDSHGSRVQPFAENDLNRVTICVAE
jgi:outer membrane protein OmpA-like peptidoglycan-associated protein